jgi:tripartite-type tricarboxylate transporter receptor subunit TctC
MSTLTRRRALAAGFALAAPAVHAQEGDFPSRSIRIIVPYAPGGQGDITARLLGEHLRPRLNNQSIVVENRSGANGAIGTEIVARARPDGYTLGCVVASHALGRALTPNLPFDPVTDFVPITIVVAAPTLPVRTLSEFIDYAKARPGQLAYKSAGPGSNSHLFGAWFTDAAGIEMLHVPYRGSGDSMNHLLTGVVHLGIDTLPAVQSHIDNRLLTLLAAGGPDRSPQYPDVPTVAEAAIPGFQANSWSMILAPRGTPAPIAERLNREILAVLAIPAVKERLERMGASPVGSTLAETATILRDEEAMYSTLIRRLNITLG